MHKERLHQLCIALRLDPPTGLLQIHDTMLVCRQSIIAEVENSLASQQSTRSSCISNMMSLDPPLQCHDNSQSLKNVRVLHYPDVENQ